MSAAHCQGISECLESGHPALSMFMKAALKDIGNH